MTPDFLTLIQAVIVGLVAYRVWRLIAVDSLFEKPRSYIEGRLAHWLACPWCAGSWVALILTVVLWLIAWVDGEAAWLIAPMAMVITGFLGERI